MQKISEPKQERSIEKKNKILDAGYKLICEKGYYNTNTAEIAKAAGVSSGIVYRYFVDKKDIFIQAIKKQTIPLFEMIFEKLQTAQNMDEIKLVLPNIINKLIELHNFSNDEFRALKAMSMMDDDFYTYFQALKEKTCSMIADTLINIGCPKKHAKEKAYWIWIVTDNLCDEYHQLKSKGLDVDFIYDQTIAFILQLINV